MTSEIWLNGETQPRLEIRGPNLVQHRVEYRLVPEAVGPYQRIDRRSSLRQSSRVFDSGGWQFDFFDRYRMTDSGKHGRHVRIDAVAEQLHQLGIAAELGNLGDQELVDRAGEHGHPLVEPADDLGRAPTDDRGIGMASFRHHEQTLSPVLSSGDKTPPRLGRLATSLFNGLLRDS